MKKDENIRMTWAADKKYLTVSFKWENNKESIMKGYAIIKNVIDHDVSLQSYVADNRLIVVYTGKVNELEMIYQHYEKKKEIFQN